MWEDGRVNRPGRERLTTAAAVAAALELLDADGLDGVTLRRLAARLEVQVPTLYRYFASKQDLLDEIAQSIVSDGLDGLQASDDADAWREWLRQTANRFHQALLSHRDAARIVAGAGLRRAPILAELTELTLQALTHGGLDLTTASQASTALFTFTLGYTIEEQAEPGPETTPDPGVLVPRFPLIADVLRQRREPGADAYAAGLEFILAGIQARADAGAS